MYIFQKDDLKYKSWSAALLEKGIETSAVTGSPMSAPALLIDKMLRGLRVDGYVFRYLNDYPSFWKSIARLTSEICVIALTKLRGGRILWVAHNVDKESSSYHSRLTCLRRWMVLKAAHAVFVTDPLLVAHAKRLLPSARSIQWTCFGRPPDYAANEGTIRVRDAIRQLRQSLQLRFPEREVYIGLCVCAASEKCVHLLSICDFVAHCSTDSVVAGMVVVSEMSCIRDHRFKEARARMVDHPHVILFDEAIQVREHHVARDTDYFYRALDDLSVSYTVYVAAAAGKPLIVEAETFLAEMVSHYRLGAVVPSSTSAPSGAWLMAQIKNWEQRQADIFLQSRTWEKAAEQFALAMSAPRTLECANRNA